MLETDNTIAFWDNVKVGAFVTLSDMQALQDVIDRRLPGPGVTYRVSEIRRFQESRNLALWYAYKLQGIQELWLVVKIVDSNVDVRVYYRPPGWIDYNRKDLLIRDMRWLFQKPKNEQDFHCDALLYTCDIVYKETPESVEVKYDLKDQGELHASCQIMPTLSGIADSMPATVVEYLANDTTPTQNRELLLLEVGGERTRDGGLVTLLLGCPISLTEIDVVNQ